MSAPVVQMTPDEYMRFWRFWGAMMVIGCVWAVTSGILLAVLILRWLGWLE